MARKISEPKQEELTRELRKLQTEALYDLYASPNIMRVNTSRRIRMVWACSRYRGKGI